MWKRKLGFEGFEINRQAAHNFEQSQPPQRLYILPSSRAHGHDNYEDPDLDNIEYEGSEDTMRENGAGDGGGDEIDPLNAFMERIHEKMKAAPPSKPKEKVEKYRDEEEDDQSFLRAKKDVGLTLASDALRADYDSDEEV